MTTDYGLCMQGLPRVNPQLPPQKQRARNLKKITPFISIHNIHYTYSYSYSDADLSLIDNILGKAPLIHLNNDDMFGSKNFFNKVVICHSRT